MIRNSAITTANHKLLGRRKILPKFDAVSVQYSAQIYTENYNLSAKGKFRQNSALDLSRMGSISTREIISFRLKENSAEIQRGNHRWELSRIRSISTRKIISVRLKENSAEIRRGICPVFGPYLQGKLESLARRKIQPKFSVGHVPYSAHIYKITRRIRE